MDEERIRCFNRARSTFLIDLVLQKCWETRVSCEICFSIQNTLISIWTLLTRSSKGLNYCNYLHFSPTNEAEKKKRNVTEWVQNRIHWRFCLIDPFINPKKYCNWLEPQFPDGMAAVCRALTSKLCFSVRTPASGSQKFLHTNLVILWHRARCSLTADLMWRPQPNLPLSPFTLKHCWISTSAHLVRILFW